MGFCETELAVPFFNTGAPLNCAAWCFFDSDDFPSGRNPYDMTKMCEGQIEDSICYPQTRCALL